MDLRILQSECEAREARILTARIASGRFVLDLLLTEPDDTLIERLARYCVDVEALARGRLDVAAAALARVHEQHEEIQRLQQTNQRLRDELRAFRAPSSAVVHRRAPERAERAPATSALRPTGRLRP